MSFVKNEKLRRLFAYGPTFREQGLINWQAVLEEATKGLNPIISQWSHLASKPAEQWSEWTRVLISKIHEKIDRLKQTTTLGSPATLEDPVVLDELKRLHSSFVCVPADKASNNVIFVLWLARAGLAWTGPA